jgi:hypothetical protein
MEALSKLLCYLFFVLFKIMTLSTMGGGDHGRERLIYLRTCNVLRTRNVDQALERRMQQLEYDRTYAVLHPSD